MTRCFSSLTPRPPHGCGSGRGLSLGNVFKSSAEAEWALQEEGPQRPSAPIGGKEATRAHGWGDEMRAEVSLQGSRSQQTLSPAWPGAGWGWGPEDGAAPGAFAAAPVTWPDSELPWTPASPSVEEGTVPCCPAVSWWVWSAGSRGLGALTSRLFLCSPGVSGRCLERQGRRWSCGRASGLHVDSARLLHSPALSKAPFWGGICLALSSDLRLRRELSCCRKPLSRSC